MRSALLSFGLAAVVPSLAFAQVSVTTKIDPETLRNPRTTSLEVVTPQKLAMMKIPIELGIHGQGTLSVGPESCVSNPAKDDTYCVVMVPSATKLTATAKPAPGLALAGWQMAACGSMRLATTCAFKPVANLPISAVFMKGNPLTVTIPQGPGYIDQQAIPGSQSPTGIQCSVGAGGQTNGACDALIPAGQSVTLKPLVSDGEAIFKGFTSGPAGCAGMACTFTPTGPSAVTAEFIPAARVSIYSKFSPTRPITVYSEGEYKLQCKIVQSTNLNCNVIAPTGSTLVIRAFYHDGGPDGPLVPMPSAEWTGPCAGAQPGRCALTVSKPVLFSIGS